MPLFAELKRRRVFRALLGYAIVAFAVLQVAEPVIHGLQLPDWTLSFVVVALGVGFPVLLVLAWVFDVSPSGIERTLPLGTEGGSRSSGALLALLATGVALLGVAVVAWHFVSRTRAGRTVPSASAPAGPSVAVLPFVNMSPEKDAEYFSDGITEEVINALANVEGVRVVSRTSAFAFKGKNVSVRKIAEELAVATVLEGSVRRQGSDVRIVAQLINAADGYHLWSKTYDRKLENVFAVEDELARSITEALRPQLLKEGPPLVRQATSSTEAHDLYLRGRHFWNKRTAEDLRRAVALFGQALAVDPGYALAHSGLADSYVLLAEYSSVPPAEVLPQATEHARKALELNPALAEPHATLGLLAMEGYDWSGAEREFRRAIELRSGYATAHHWYALLLGTLGRFAEARAEAEQAVRLDPASLVVNNMLGMVFYASGRPRRDACVGAVGGWRARGRAAAGARAGGPFPARADPAGHPGRAVRAPGRPRPRFCLAGAGVRGEGLDVAGSEGQPDAGFAARRPAVREAAQEARSGLRHERAGRRPSAR